MAMLVRQLVECPFFPQIHRATVAVNGQTASMALLKMQIPKARIYIHFICCKFFESHDKPLDIARVFPVIGN